MRWFVLPVFAALLLALATPTLAADPFLGVDPYWVLLHEPAVREDLKLTDSQRKAFVGLIDELDIAFFQLRNKTREQAIEGSGQLIADAKERLTPILKPDQQKRLQQILQRKLGTSALLRDDLAAKMRYTRSQREKLTKIIDDTQSAVAALEKEANAGQPREPLEKKYIELRTDEQKQILELLSPTQKNAWREAIGPAFDTSKLGQPAYKAPQLADTSEWINSQPLQLESLRGQVVVVHFYACGCINCVRNYPWLRQWHETYKGKGALLVGIHTPETPGERDVATVRRKAAEEKLPYPILIDTKSENWNAWGNSMWPSVYLIDKRGYLRHFWPGELKWQGNDGEKYMRQRIDELLAE